MNRLVVTDDGNRIRATVYSQESPMPTAVVELTVKQAVKLAAELAAAAARRLAWRAEYR